MKCAHCGKEFKKGQVYCPHCGKMQQLVPDYNEAEEEILKDTAKHAGNADPQRTDRSQDPGTDAVSSDGGISVQKKAKRPGKRLKGILITVVILAAVLLFALFAFRYKIRNDYDAQMKKAQTAYDNGAYDQALTHAQRALSLNDESIEARILLYEIYDATGIYNITLLTEVLTLDPDNEDAYRYLIIYYEANDYDALLELAQNVPDEDLLTLFEGYLTAEPVISPQADTYTTVTQITITSDDTVYYTTDGSTPTTDSLLYTEPFELEEGSWVIRAAAYDAQGHASLTVSAIYTIAYEVPEAVSISPAGGSYTQSVEIVLTAEDGCTIFYGWDTTDISELTTVYSGSLWIPEGNHILSAVAVSPEGVYSEISSRSFIYLPEEETDTVSDTAQEAAE